ncbi:MAG: hypothetical protein ABI171_15025 [Collimonas sp.]|uniref:hypothetical protein n=1 Tax=Collimonas sp. TaxID=1963772 RepID=UPI0032649D33
MQAVKKATQAGAAVHVFRAMHWWQEAELAGLALRLDRSRQQWRSAWLDDLSPQANESVDGDIISVLAHHVDVGYGSGNWQALFPDDEGVDAQVWLDAGQASIETMSALLLNMPGPPQSRVQKDVPSLAVELAQAAWQDCINNLRSCLGHSGHPESESNAPLRPGLSEEALPPQHMFAWSGAVRVALPWYGMQLALHIGPARAAKLLGRDEKMALQAHVASSNASLVPVHKAIAQQTTSLRLELSAVELDLGSLQALVLGDIIPLPHGLEQPLAVIGEDGKLLCDAYLGQQQGMRAVELVLAGTDELPANASSL